MKIWLCLNLLIGASMGLLSSESTDLCGLAKNCTQCMGQAADCSWCFDSSYEDSNYGPSFRCAPRDVLLERGCSEDSIEYVTSQLKPQPSNPVPFAPDVQLKPGLQTARLRPGSPTQVAFNFTSISDYPVDLYYLTDLSYSMKDDLATVSRQADVISKTMRRLTKMFRIGFGAFVDKPVVPFVNPKPSALANPCEGLGKGMAETCDPPFLYKHVLSLTANISKFREKTGITKPSGNLDSPEGGLDALLQVAHCHNEVGWQASARKIVLFSTDGPFHVAGDGKLAGLVLPPPTQCQMAYKADSFNNKVQYLGWHDSTKTDYPSVGELARVLNEADINVIFATSPEQAPLYEKLAALLPSAAVGILREDSDNIVALLEENYKKIVSTVALQVTEDDQSDDLEVKILTRCYGEAGFTEKRHCQNHPLGKSIEYRLMVTPRRCFEGVRIVRLQMSGLADKAILEVRSACECERCERIYATPTASKCYFHGTLLGCGMCMCNTGRSGDFCECASQDPGVEEAKCFAPGDKAEGLLPPCSGRGRCRCGKCQCSLPRYKGLFCECDLEGCKRASDDNKVCGGPLRGNCHCNGTCVCEPGYTGERCDCMSSKSNCQDPKNPPGTPLCSDKGKCDCGVCFCNSGWTGLLCNERQGGEGPLCTDQEIKHCVLCLHRKEAGDGKKECAQVCNKTSIDTSKVEMMVDGYNTQDGSNLCVIYDERDCRVYFTYRYSDVVYADRKVLVRIQTTNECPTKVNLWLIIGGVVGGIVAVGIILLLIWKLVVTIDDRRELAKFQKETENAKWEMEENPIFKAPVTTVTNPMYTGID